MRWIVSLCRTNDDTADRGTTVLAIETKHGTFITDTLLLTYDKKKTPKHTNTVCVSCTILQVRGFHTFYMLLFCVETFDYSEAQKQFTRWSNLLICCKVPLRGRNGSWRLYSLENNRTDGNEIEYGYPITCGDSRAVLLFKKFVCPGINVRCVKVSWLLFVDN